MPNYQSELKLMNYYFFILALKYENIMSKINMEEWKSKISPILHLWKQLNQVFYFSIKNIHLFQTMIYHNFAIFSGGWNFENENHYG